MEGRFSRIFERILVFSTVVSLMLTATSVFSPSLNNYDVERVLIDWFTYLLIIVSGIVFTLVLQIFTLEKIKPAMHIVFIVFYIIGLLVLCYISGKTNAPYVLIFIIVIQYFLQTGINELFIFHDAFMLDCEAHEGKELEQYLFHNNLSAIDLTEKIKNQQAMMFAISIAMFIVLVFGKLSQGLFTPITIALIIIFYLSILLCCFMLGIFKNDIFYAFLGFKDYVQNGRKLFKAVLLIAAISCISGALLSSDTPLIKINYVQEYKEAQDAKQVSPPMPEFTEPIFDRELFEELDKNYKPNWIIEFIFEVIKYCAIAAIVIGAIIFFIKPLFSRHFKLFWTEGHLILFFKKVWTEIKDFLKFIFSKDQNVSSAYSTVQSKKFHDSMMDFLKKAKRSKEKTAEIDRLTKQFMRLIDWGESQGIKFKETFAPAEYTNLISEKVDATEKKTAASNAGHLFEKALYDKCTLTEDEEALFLKSLNIIYES